jgi:hypothetical protein
MSMNKRGEEKLKEKQRETLYFSGDKDPGFEGSWAVPPHSFRKSMLQRR